MHSIIKTQTLKKASPTDVMTINIITHGEHFAVSVYSMQLSHKVRQSDGPTMTPPPPECFTCAAMFQGGRRSGLFGPSTASLPAFSSLSPRAEESDLTLRPSCTLGPEAATPADAPSPTGTPLSLHQYSVLSFTRF